MLRLVIISYMLIYATKEKKLPKYAPIVLLYLTLCAVNTDWLLQAVAVPVGVLKWIQVILTVVLGFCSQWATRRGK